MKKGDLSIFQVENSGCEFPARFPSSNYSVNIHPGFFAIFGLASPPMARNSPWTRCVADRDTSSSNQSDLGNGIKREIYFNEDNGSAVWTNDVMVTGSNNMNLDDHDGRNNINNDNNVINIEKVAIIVPFRDLHAQQKRSQHLKKFIPYMTDFLLQATNYSNIEFKIYIIEQSNDGRKFNRGKLLNIGYLLALQDDASVFIFHDVDLLPSKDLLYYYTTRPLSQPIHIAKLWDRYNKNTNYFGGIAVFSRELYERINGYPNNFWGKVYDSCLYK
jgi:hypothetical protein